MTYNNILDFFRGDEDLLKYFDPTSSARNNEEAALEIYQKLIEYSRKYRCRFIRLEYGYIFYAKNRWPLSGNMLISFCVKPEFRSKTLVANFWKEIIRNVGDHFTCCLFSKNTRAISFLKKGGMSVQKTNDSITLLSI